MRNIDFKFETDIKGGKEIIFVFAFFIQNQIINTGIKCWNYYHYNANWKPRK